MLIHFPSQKSCEEGVTVTGVSRLEQAAASKPGCGTTVSHVHLCPPLIPHHGLYPGHIVAFELWSFSKNQNQSLFMQVNVLLPITWEEITDFNQMCHMYLKQMGKAGEWLTLVYPSLTFQQCI